MNADPNRVNRRRTVKTRSRFTTLLTVYFFVALIIPNCVLANTEPYSGWTVEALGNVLKNCMEHAQSVVRVGARETALYTEITVRDDGPGMDPDDIPHLFERFYRGKNANQESFGIGLALSRAILAAQNGTIRAENAREGGALFTLRVYKGVV